MIKTIHIIILLVCSLLSRSQSVGIGTTSPEYMLHVKTLSGESSIGINAAGTSPQSLLNLSIDNRIDGNSLLLLKYRTGVTGSIAGIPKSNLSVLATDVAAGPLLITTNQSSDMYFATNAIERMRLLASGYLGINTTSPLYKLHVEEGDRTAIYARITTGLTDTSAIRGVLDNPTTTGSRSAGVRGQSTSTTSYSIGVYGTQNGGGWGIAGSVKEGGVSGWGAGVYGESGLNGISSGTGGYGVYGTNFNASGIAGNFTNFDAGANSKALKTSGKLQFTSIGESSGKVLTSDASGNATWSAVPGAIAITQTFQGFINTTPTLSTGAYEFVGPTAIVTLAANQRVILMVMAPLGRSTIGSATNLQIDIGYQPNAGGAILNSTGGNFMYINPYVAVANERSIYPVSGTMKPGAGTWKIGMVMANTTVGTVGFFNNNDFLNATYMIINE